MTRGRSRREAGAAVVRNAFTPQVYVAVDGGGLGFEPPSVHWRLGEWLLTTRGLNPSDDLIAQSWYQSAVALLLRDLRFGELSGLLEFARRRMPKDTLFLFAWVVVRWPPCGAPRVPSWHCSATATRRCS